MDVTPGHIAKLFFLQYRTVPKEDDSKMKSIRPQTLCFFLLTILAGLLSYSAVLAEIAGDYNAKPPFVTRGADPNVLLNLSIETPMYGAAYNDQYDDKDKNGTIEVGECNGRIWESGYPVGTCYYPGNEYLGIFDPEKEYSYNSTSGYYVPIGSLNTDHSTKQNGWSGNFLNWATMTAIDEFRWALTGGRRTQDTTSLSVIQRANLPSGYNTSWHQAKKLNSTINVAPSSVTPYTNSTIYIYSHEYRVNIGTTLRGSELANNLEVSVQVCDQTVGLEDNCVPYKEADGTVYYKPEGLIQKNADRMRFAVMSYAYDGNQSRHGGVLRATMKYVGPKLPDGSDNPRKEYGTNGIYIADPDDATFTSGSTNQLLSNSGVINYVNKFGTNGYKSYDPVGELFYECLNYFKNRGPTLDFYNGLSTTAYDGFPVITSWDDPIESWCQPNFIVGINDANPWLDKKLPGTHFTTSTFNSHPLIGSDYGEPTNADTDYSVTALTNTVGELEGLNGTEQYVGCTINNCDMSNTPKTIPGLGEVFGTFPGPGKENSYYVAGLAYYANTYDIRDDLDGKQTITTFMIDTQEYSSTPLVGRMNMLWLTGKYGGFKELDHPDPDSVLDNSANAIQPNLQTEWDADNDGDPDNYVLATNPEKLITGLSNVFLDISKRASSGTAASVISGSRSGEGAVYQSVFYPTYEDASQNRVVWAGAVHASFVDAYGRLREDTNGNGILEDNDYVVIFNRDPNTNDLTISKFSVVGAVAEVTAVTLREATLLQGKYFTINSVTDEYYVWFTVDGNGTDPQPAYDMTGIRVSLDAADSAQAVAYKTGAAISSLSYTFSVDYSASSETITITNVTAGEAEDATMGDSTVGILISPQGSGESTTLSFTGAAESIKYLWNSTNWLNGISDTNIAIQRDPYSSTDPKRYIFTFIDADQDGIADTGEQLAFAAETLPTDLNIVDTSTIFPYIPVSSNSETLPSYAGSSAAVAEVTSLTFSDASTVMRSKYFLVNSPGNEFYVWFRVSGPGADGSDPGPTTPSLSGKIGVRVNIDRNDNDDEVAPKVRAALMDLTNNPEASAAFNVSTPSGSTLTITNNIVGDVTDASAGTLGSSYITLNVTSQGVVGVNNVEEFLQYQTQRVINYIRGQDQGEQTITSATIPAFRSRQVDYNGDGTLETWRLGDIVYSSPTVVNKPQENLHLLYKDSSYGAFAAKYLHRRNVIYTGANDGMLHAFNGGFYEDRFDVYTTNTDGTADGIKDAQYLTQPKTSAGIIDNTVSAYELGQELWAYIPYNLLPHLYWLTEIDYDHVYYVDLKPRVFDAKIFADDTDHPGGWGTVLVGGMRFGGGKISVDMDRTDGNYNTDDRTMRSAYYVLDITNPEKPPTVLGEITFPHLGYTTCYPTVAAVKSRSDSTINNWYLIFGSGPAESDGSPGTVSGTSLAKAMSEQSAKLYVVDLLALVKDKTLKALNPSGAMVAISSGDDGFFMNFADGDSPVDNNAFVSDPVTVDYDLDYQADVVYFGTVSYLSSADANTSPWGGKLRRLVMDKEGASPILPTNTATWDGDSVLLDLETNFHQPITAAPAVGLDPYGSAWVYFGSGRYFIRDDGTIEDQESFYGIREPIANISADGVPAVYANSYATVDYANLNNATNVEVSRTTRMVSGCNWCTSPISWTDFVRQALYLYPGGWAYDFTDDRERNVSQSALYGDILTFTTYNPSNDMCDYEGNGWLYGLYYMTGTATPIDVFSSTTTTLNVIKRVSTGTGPPSKPGIHVDSPTDHGDTTAFVQTSDGAIVPIKQDNYGATHSGKTAWSYKEE